MNALTGFLLATCLLWLGLGAFVGRMALIQRGLERRLRLLERDNHERQGEGRSSHE